jgi:hypothetical protein
VAKWYYHALFTCEDDAKNDTRAQLDSEIYKNKPNYENELLFAGRAGRFSYKTNEPLRRLRDGDVLTVDAHGSETTHKIGAITGDTKKTSWLLIGANDLAERLKKDGLDDLRVLIRLIICHGAEVKANDNRSTGSVLAKALKFKNVVVEAYEGEISVIAGASKAGGPRTGIEPENYQAWRFRKYYNWKGDEITQEQVREITGIPVGKKARGGT